MLKFCLRIVLFSALLFLAKDALATAYNVVLRGVCHLMGIRLAADAALYDSSLRTIPFIVLMLATTGIVARKRWGAVAAGLAVFLALDLVSTLIWKSLPPRPFVSGSQAHLMYSMIWELSGHWILPYLMWFVAAKAELAAFLAAVRPLGATASS